MIDFIWYNIKNGYYTSSRKDANNVWTIIQF